jgi:hypothetical protein
MKNIIFCTAILFAIAAAGCHGGEQEHSSNTPKHQSLPEYSANNTATNTNAVNSVANNANAAADLPH